jgi:CubicO group peptidase (beta-lactamase class C family)
MWVILVVALTITALFVNAPLSEALAANKSSLEGLDEFIVEQMKESNVPGLAIAIVRDGKVVHSKGYGFRDVEKRLPVTLKTLFAIGSITKSFAVVSLGALADEGKLDWDQPVREYVPNFGLYDPVASERITMRDLVSHRSGLPRHDFFMYHGGFSQKEMIERLRYLEPSHDLRTTYQYSNLLFMTAGCLGGQLAGTTWEELTRQKVLAPLGMERTNFSVRESQKTGDFALPYRKVNEELKEIPHQFLNFPEEGAAGIINSNLEEMSRYLLFYVNEGNDGKSPVLSRQNMVQMQTSMIAKPPWLYTEFGPFSYGMGLTLTTYRGHRCVMHGGGLHGFTALFSFMPQQKTGIIVLTNGESLLPEVVTFNAYDRLLGLEHVAWTQRFKEQQQKQKESATEAEKKGYTTRKTGTRPSHVLRDYVGEYEHPGYGTVRIDLENDELRLAYNKKGFSPLKHFHYDIFEFIPEPVDESLGKMKVSFSTNLQGEIDRLQIPMEEHVKEIAFDRRPAKGMTEKSFLQPLAGNYELAGNPVTVALKGDSRLVLTNWGAGQLAIFAQREYELLPTRGLSFEIKGLTGFTVEFKKDHSNQVTEMVFYEPNRVLVAKKSSSR